MLIKPSLMNVVSIGLMAFMGVWVVNRALIYAGLPHLTAQGSNVNQ